MSGTARPPEQPEQRTERWVFPPQHAHNECQRVGGVAKEGRGRACVARTVLISVNVPAKPLGRHRSDVLE
jgi:hypothetical protein